jgi:hypothetical protein
MHVEDHPVEYLHLAGVLPSGEYGGGEVIVWDTGTWEPVRTADPPEAVRRGGPHAELHGEKLRGRLITLVVSLHFPYCMLAGQNISRLSGFQAGRGAYSSERPKSRLTALESKAAV